VYRYNQFCEQRGSWAEEGLRRAKATLTAARQILGAMQEAAKAQKDYKAASRRRAAEVGLALVTLFCSQNTLYSNRCRRLPSKKSSSYHNG
jgi:hypothetical protein